MEIIIKSFNRPYYLDKCLASIQQYVEGFTVIKILDDGTPEKYLQKLQNKYPSIEIHKSKLSEKKEKQIENQVKIDNQIPVELWVNSVRNSSDYFILLEDDMWFVGPISIFDLSEELERKSIEMVKLFWLNNPILVSENIQEINSNIAVYSPEIKIKNPTLYNLVFHSKLPKMRSLMKILGLFSPENELKYYQLYNVAGAIFSKQYFLSLWDMNQNVVSEKNQILNALKYFDKNPKSKVGKVISEIINTGFVTSALQKDYIKGFNIEQANNILNELWFLDALNTEKYVFKDIEINLYKNQIIEKSSAEFYEKWLLWIQKFKKQYTDIGCRINE